MRLVFDQRECGDHAVLGWQPSEGLADTIAAFALNSGVGRRVRRQIVGKLGLIARSAQVVESRICSDAVGPGSEIAGRIEARAVAIDAPKRFHSEILCNTRVADNSNDPGIDLLLVLAKQHLEGFQVTRREPFQKVHSALSLCSYYWASGLLVTECFTPESRAAWVTRGRAWVANANQAWSGSVGSPGGIRRCPRVRRGTTLSCRLWQQSARHGRRSLRVGDELVAEAADS